LTGAARSVTPGEIVVGAGPVPTPLPARRELVSVTNRGRFDAYLTSHFPVAAASSALEFARPTGAAPVARDQLDGARPLLPAGASVLIGPGETVSLELAWD
jgi:urease beta subunit